MGFLRLYLAICVVFVHAGTSTWWTVHDGTQAVQIFFMISGFYMQMIAGKYPTAYSFWLSRAVRIYAPYFAALVMSILCAGVLWSFEKTLGPCSAFANQPLSHNSAAGIIAATLTNFSVVGQDLTLFLTANANHGFELTANVHEIPFPLYRYLLIPQAWTIALELYFYALVPVLALRSTRFLWCLLASSTILRLFAYSVFQLTHDPWIYRFFPFEIALFVAGMLAWRHSQSRLRSIDIKWTAWKYFVFVVAATLLFWIARKFVSFGFRFLGYAYLVQFSYLMWVTLIPILFQITRKHRLDRFLGELSYPVYLVHMAVIPVAGMLCSYIPFLSRGTTTLSLTMVVSIAFVLFLIRPLDAWRAQLHNGNTRPIANSTNVVHCQ
jgi:peptidoglycan/LPS O-acetylase OafA/YrhL